MTDMDQGIKRLIQYHPADIIGFAKPGLEYVAPRATDVALEPELVLDTLYEGRYQGFPCLIDIEGQAYPAADVPERCRIYAARAKAIHKLDTFSIVFWLKKKGKIPPNPHVVKVGDAVLGTWNYTSIEVYRLQARDIISAGVMGLLPLVPFMAGADVPTIERAAAVVKERAVDQDEVKTLETILAVFASLFHGKEATMAMFRRLFMNTELIGDSPIFQDMIGRATKQGMQQGLNQGLRSLPKRALVKRFGALPADVNSAIDAADDDLLDTLVLQVGTATYEQIRVLLGLSV